MELIIVTILLLLIATKLNRFIKKHFYVLSIFITVVSIISYYIKDLENIINTGFVGLAFFVVVMFQSAFKRGSILYNKTLSVRKEYSIFGFIFLIPHALIFLLGEHQVLEWNGIIAFIIMIPLFITSFIIIRKKMKVKLWRNLHLLSYIAYILMFTHLILVSDSINKAIYAVLAGVYIALKIKNNGFKRLDTRYKKLILLGILVITACINIYALTDNEQVAVLKDSQYRNGIYYGEAAGFQGKTVKVNVEVKDDIITNIEILDFGGTHPHRGVNFEQSVHKMKDKIIESQSLQVDVISGATRSTTGLKNAVNNALKKALITK